MTRRNNHRAQSTTALLPSRTATIERRATTFRIALETLRSFNTLVDAWPDVLELFHRLFQH